MHTYEPFKVHENSKDMIKPKWEKLKIAGKMTKDFTNLMLLVV